VAREGVEPPTPAFFRAAYYRAIMPILQLLNSAEWHQFWDHSVTSADVRLASAQITALNG